MVNRRSKESQEETEVWGDLQTQQPYDNENDVHDLNMIIGESLRDGELQTGEGVNETIQNKEWSGEIKGTTSTERNKDGRIEKDIWYRQGNLNKVAEVELGMMMEVRNSDKDLER
ncbi:MAG: hypothetical protein Ta2E_09500 [Mycoplasmoidaceae bacterium]|nr:MAG: hypothetical protein Ta2E_09500 [Mycoplasmoidaceae bacterium]